MATTATTDVAGLIPNVIAARSFDTTVAEVRVSPLAEEIRDLEANPGDRVSIGTWGDVGEALDLAELDEIVPDKLAATAAPFIASRIGKGVAYSYMGQKFSAADLNAKAGQALGSAFARKIDRKLILNAYNGRDVARQVGNATTPPALTRVLFEQMVDQFGEQQDGLTAVMTRPQLRALVTDLGAYNAGVYGSNEVITGGVRVVADLLGVNITTSERLPLVGGGHPILMFRPNRTLVSAYSMRPLIEAVRVPKGARVEVYGNSVWAGGVQEPATLTVGHFAN